MAIKQSLTISYFSLEENNKPVVATEEQMESLGNYQRVTKEEVSEDNTCCICLAPYKQGEGRWPWYGYISPAIWCSRPS